MIQNGVVCYPGPALLLFIFRFEYFRARKVTGTFEKRAPGPKSAYVTKINIPGPLRLCNYRVQEPMTTAPSYGLQPSPESFRVQIKNSRGFNSYESDAN